MRTNGSGAGTVRDSVVEVRNLGKCYADFWAVRGVDFTIRPGEVLGLIGANGAGKSTTLKSLAGLLEPTEGSVRIAGERADLPDARRHVGYLPEESPLYDDMTPRSYLKLFADLYGLPKRESRERAESLLDDLKLEHRDRRIADLSKGMRRKVAIARSLLHDPSVLIWDEPASGLDPVMSAFVLDVLQGMRKEGRTIVFSAHNLYHVERVCDRVLILAKGKVAHHGSVAELRARGGGTRYRVRLDVPVGDAVPVEGGGFEVTVSSFDEVAALERAAQAQGGRVTDVRTLEVALEELFLAAQAQ